MNGTKRLLQFKKVTRNTLLNKLAPRVAEFEISQDAKIILEAIRRNRKFLIEKFNEISPDGNFVTFEDAKEIIRTVQRGKEIEDDQLKIILKGAIKEGDMVDFKKLGKKDIKTKFS